MFGQWYFSASLPDSLSVNAVVAEPIEKGISPIVGIVRGQSLHTFRIHRIGLTLLAVRSLEFEVVSDTHELNIVCV